METCKDKVDPSLDHQRMDLDGEMMLCGFLRIALNLQRIMSGIDFSLLKSPISEY